MEKTKAAKKKKLILWMTVITMLFAVQFMPQTVQAAEQTVGNMVIMVTFEKDSAGNTLKNEFTEGYDDNYFHYCWSNYNYSGTNAIYFRDIYTKSTGSLPHYINTVSDGKVQVNNYFPQENADGSLSVITLPGSAYDYLNQANIEDSVFMAAVVQAMQNTNFSKQLSASELDSWNSDGYIDNLTILVQGPNTGSFTPHKSDYAGNQEVCFGLKVGAYNILPTESIRSYGYSVASHEFMHTLGAPDLYRTSLPGTPVGIWDQMAQVSWTAQYPLVYTRKELGWLTIPDIATSGDYTLAPATASSGNRAYIIKTALSDTEYFVVEYRQQKSYGEYDYNIPVTNGLIVYRVNEAVTDHTNKVGDNYMYVFRPGTAEDHEAATEMITVDGTQRSAVYAAAIGTSSRPSLGSSDMSAPCTQDTIFYSDGSNSGIVIDNIQFNSDGTATFHVELPTLSGDEYWLKQDAAISDMQMISMAKDEKNGVLYVAGADWQNSNGQVRVYENHLDGTGWNQVGQDLEACGTVTPKAYLYGNVLYLAYQNRQNQTCVTSLQGNVWSTPVICNDNTYGDNYQFVENQGSLWLAYSSGNYMKIWNVQSGEQKAILQVSSISIGNPSVFSYGGELYAVYADFFAADANAKRGRIAKYSESQKAWQDIYVINGISTVSVSDVHVLGDKIYVVASSSAEEPVLLWGTPETGFAEDRLSGIRATNRVQIQWKDQVAYLIWCDGSSLRARYQKQGQWTDMATQICSDAQMFDSIVIGSTLYVGNSSQASSITVRKMKTVEGTPSTPNPPSVVPGSNEVVIALPAGYDAAGKIYIDGVEYTSAKWNQSSSERIVSIGNQNAKTAVMYQYNASNIPVGMYVWTLNYNGSYYTAQAVPELQDLFSYHGFSVRYTGKTGLRCSFGIDTTKKSQLINQTGLGGYQLKEMGTLIMNPDNRVNYPMVYGGEKVAGGRTFYIENGKTYNKVIRTVNGREQFANVLVGLPESRYATDYVFRAYAVLEHNGTQSVIYGPEMSRSMYTVCKQILNRGDFKHGTAGYEFLKNIVDSVEKP